MKKTNGSRYMGFGIALLAVSGAGALSMPRAFADDPSPLPSVLADSNAASEASGAATAADANKPYDVNSTTPIGATDVPAVPQATSAIILGTTFSNVTPEPVFIYHILDNCRLEQTTPGFEQYVPICLKRADEQIDALAQRDAPAVADIRTQVEAVRQALASPQDQYAQVMAKLATTLAAASQTPTPIAIEPSLAKIKQAYFDVQTESFKVGRQAHAAYDVLYQKWDWASLAALQKTISAGIAIQKGIMTALAPTLADLRASGKTNRISLADKLELRFKRNVNWNDWVMKMRSQQVLAMQSGNRTLWQQLENAINARCATFQAQANRLNIEIAGLMKDIQSECMLVGPSCSVTPSPSPSPSPSAPVVGQAPSATGIVSIPAQSGVAVDGVGTGVPTPASSTTATVNSSM